MNDEELHLLANLRHLKGMDAKHLGKGIHEALTHWTMDRVWKRYATIDFHVEYHEETASGECDLLGDLRGDGRRLDYYEMKSHHCPEALDRALKQFRRASRTYPGVDWRFIYVTPEQVKLYHSYELERPGFRSRSKYR